MEGGKPRRGLPQRRLIACAVILVFLFVWIGLCATISGLLPKTPLTQLLFYAVAGTCWGLPVLPVISWSEAYRKRRK